MAELALNNRILTIIKKSAFYTNYSKHPNFFNILKKSPQAEAALKKINNLKRIYEKLSKNIKYQQKRGEPNVNKKKKESQLKKRDKIYLFIKNLKTLRLNKKLDHKKIGFFYIKKKDQQRQL